MHLAMAEEVSILSERIVEFSQSISIIEDTKELKHACKKLKKFAKKVIEANLDTRMNRAVFLDRDGTINEDVGALCSKDSLIFIPHALEALRILQKQFQLFIITNQAWIGKNVFSEEEYLEFSKYFEMVLKNKGITIKHIYHCPHTKEENCICRKPGSYFIKEAERDYGIDLENSFVIGDHQSDIEMGRELGVSSVYVLTGHGKEGVEELTVKPDFIARNIYEAAAWIMKAGKDKNCLS